MAVKCKKCFGRGIVKCTMCKGTGYITKKDLYSISIYGKANEIKNSCPKCRGLGIIDCEKCRGTGAN